MNKLKNNQVYGMLSLLLWIEIYKKTKPKHKERKRYQLVTKDINSLKYMVAIILDYLEIEGKKARELSIQELRNYIQSELDRLKERVNITKSKTKNKKKRHNVVKFDIR